MTRTESLLCKGGKESSKASNKQLFTPEPTPEPTSEPLDDAGDASDAGSSRAGSSKAGSRRASGDNPIGRATSLLTEIGNASKHVTDVSKTLATELANYVLDYY